MSTDAERINNLEMENAHLRIERAELIKKLFEMLDHDDE